jgi:copper chaperone
MAELSMDIGGMSCGHCVGAVRKALQELPGVDVQQVDIGSAQVRFDDANVTEAQISEAVEAAGYRVLSTR